MAFNINPMARTLAMFVNSLRPKKIAIYGAAMFITANINKATARLYDAIVPKSFLSQSDLRITKAHDDCCEYGKHSHQTIVIGRQYPCNKDIADKTYNLRTEFINRRPNVMLCITHSFA